MSQKQIIHKYQLNKIFLFMYANKEKKNISILYKYNEKIN